MVAGKSTLEYCEAVCRTLKTVEGYAPTPLHKNGPRWSEFFVTFRMEFQRHYLKGVVCSTLLGADFFEFTARALRGEEQERLYRPKSPDKDKDGEFNEGFNLEYRKWIEKERNENVIRDISCKENGDWGSRG